MNSDERLSRPSDIRTIKLGETTVTYVPDGVVQLSPRGWLPTSTDDVWAAHPEYLDADGFLVASIGALLVERDGRAMLIDSGLGPYSSPATAGEPIGAAHGGALPDNLKSLGHTPADIEAIAITHLHADHFGWAAVADPIFTNAEVLVAESEWTQGDNAERQAPLDILAPRVRTVADGEEIFPGVRVLALPGHTVGHTGYVVSDGDRRVIAFGDAMHSPVQIGHPDWHAVVDNDRDQANDHRRLLLAELRKPDTIGFGVHFADVVFGQVGAAGTWSPVP